jgi:curved DNA-binding protein CbpA
MADPYDILGVKREASLSEIKSAYKNLAKKLHPDKTGANPRALEQMKLVNEAYASLCGNLQRRGEFSEMTVDETARYTEEVWKAYSKQVEEYYQQVQSYLEDQTEQIRKERDRLARLESDLRKRESGLDVQRKAIETERKDNVRLLEREKEIKRREDYISKQEDELDELLIHISRSNSIVAEMVQSSKSLRKRA